MRVLGSVCLGGFLQYIGIDMKVHTATFIPQSQYYDLVASVELCNVKLRDYLSAGSNEGEFDSGWEGLKSILGEMRGHVAIIH